MSRIKSKYKKFLLIFVFGGLYLLSEFFSTGRALQLDRTVIWIFDVGQGDSIFINGPDKQVLIDGGPGDLVLEKLSNVLPFWDQSIDLVINTHPHADHITGLISVLKQYEIGEVLISPAAYNTAGYFTFRELAQNERVPTIQEIIDLGEGASLRVIYVPSVFPDSYFDKIVIVDAFHHFQNQKIVCQEIRK